MKSTEPHHADRRAWRLPELARAHGLSVSFLRLEAARGRLRIRRLGRAVVVMDHDWHAYLAGAESNL
jgi:hypothetical protein